MTTFSSIASRFGVIERRGERSRLGADWVRRREEVRDAFLVVGV
jgi:hypothetical protein